LLDSKGLKLNRLNDRVNISSLYEVRKSGFISINEKTEELVTYYSNNKVYNLINDLITFDKFMSDNYYLTYAYFKKEIDSQRVKHIAHQYITKPNSIKYFPPSSIVRPKKFK
jgi:hypothetical protein